MHLSEERSFVIGDKNCFAELSQVTHHMTHMKCDKLQFRLRILSNCRALLGIIDNMLLKRCKKRCKRLSSLLSSLMGRDSEEGWTDDGTNQEGFGDMLSARRKF